MKHFSRILSLFILLSLGGLTVAKNGEKYYVKHLAFPPGATIPEKIDMASRLVPNARQMAWQELEMTAFLHFGINTFTGREWGDGSEDPRLFNPTELDAEQWVKTLKEGGFKMVILTAKHHDGFCLWPTRTTAHSVASSPWKNGKGDVVRELRDACDKYGMKFGVYLSPWDRNAECYGDSPRYNDFFVNQLTELLTNYGEVHEVWFDGACGEGPNGKKQVYDWARFYETIHRLQPNAGTAIMGDDVRWVGNEKGEGRETEWSATALVPGGYERADAENKRLGIYGTAKELGSLELIAKAKELFWYPSEVDVSIRPGWFYHDREDSQVKSLSKLVDIYFTSVGRNSVLLLNIPPDKRGLIHETDAARIRELNAYVSRNLSRSLLADGDKYRVLTVGTPQMYKVQGKGATVNTVMLCEDVAKGQRVEAFAVDAQVNGEWKRVAEGTTVGYKRLLRFPECEASALRVCVTSARGRVNMKRVAAFCIEEIREGESDLVLSEVPVKDWKVVSATGGDLTAAKAAIDGNGDTFWKSTEGKGVKQMVVDMGKSYKITGFSYLPRNGEDKSGTVYNYKFFVSDNGTDWKECKCSGEFSNIMHNPVAQFVRFDTPCQARYFKFEALTEIDNRDFVTVGELGILVK